MFTMNDFSPEKLSSLESVEKFIFVVSTAGQGNFPLNARIFWKSLMKFNAAENSMKFVEYAIFGLGDSHFWKNRTGRVFPYRTVIKILERLAKFPFF